VVGLSIQMALIAELEIEIENLSTGGRTRQ
jgi:hypothetical protein